MAGAFPPDVKAALRDNQREFELRPAGDGENGRPLTAVCLTDVFDDVDNDCDGTVDDSPVDGDTYYPDSDGDGYGDPDGADTSCDLEAGWVTDMTDCDDTDGDVNPAETEVCNDIDDDCDRAIDDSDRSLDTSTTTTWYADEDGDDFGDADNTTNACEAPLEPIGYTGCAASPISVVRPKVHCGIGSRSTSGYS